MNKLYELIKLISSNSFIVCADGVFIPIDNVATALLDKHREEINTLCAQNDLQFSVAPPTTEEVQQAKLDDEGRMIGMETVTKFVKKNNYEQKGGFWLGTANTTPDAFAKALGK